jgi:hypothetical protein
VKYFKQKIQKKQKYSAKSITWDAEVDSPKDSVLKESKLNRKFGKIQRRKEIWYEFLYKYQNKTKIDQLVEVQH